MTPDNETGLTDDGATRLLRAADPRPRERMPGCPDDELIAAYVDGGVGPAERESIEAHLADCAYCLALVGLLVREDRADGEAAVPETTAARVTRLPRPTGAAPVRHLPRWAAAAAVLAALPVLLHISRSIDERPGVGSEPAPRVIRNASPAPHGLQVLLPAAGAVIDPRELSIRWSPVPGSAYYDVRIVTDAGVPLIEQRVTGTEWRPDVGLKLEPGTEYYVRVDAYPADGKSVGSVHVPFTVRE